MSDNLTRYFAIQQALRKHQTTLLRSNFARHLNTLAALICGVAGSQSCRLPAIARKVPGPKQRQSQVIQFRRWLANERIDATLYYQPYVQSLLESMPEGPLVLVIDSSTVGRGCLALVVSVLYKKRALPLCWTVVAGKKGHVSESVHLGLLRQAACLLPNDRTIIFLGDGEFNGIDLLDFMQRQGWSFVCRVPKNTVFAEGSEWLTLNYFPCSPAIALKWKMSSILRTLTARCC